MADKKKLGLMYYSHSDRKIAIDNLNRLISKIDEFSDYAEDFDIDTEISYSEYVQIVQYLTMLKEAIQEEDQEDQSVEGCATSKIKSATDTTCYDYRGYTICDKNGCWYVDRDGESVGTFSTDSEAEDYIDDIVDSGRSRRSIPDEKESVFGNSGSPNRVVDILMRRDGMSRDEAEEEVNYVRDMMQDAIDSGDYNEAEDILADELGLELDYVWDILGL